MCATERSKIKRRLEIPEPGVREKEAKGHPGLRAEPLGSPPGAVVCAQLQVCRGGGRRFALMYTFRIGDVSTPGFWYSCWTLKPSGYQGTTKFRGSQKLYSGFPLLREVGTPNLHVVQRPAVN